jgi:hypothetical protein
MINLLPAKALTGKRIGISVSESPDLNRFGLLEPHFRLAIGEIARCVLVADGKLAYGGHLKPTGYTAFLLKELQRYSNRRDSPLLICLAWQEHRKLRLSELAEAKNDLGLFGKIVYLNPDGEAIRPDSERGEDPAPVDDQELRKRSLTNLRRYMCKNTDGRVLIGGKRHGFQGEFPGILEEALITLEAKQPLYLAGGFGGVTLDIAYALDISIGEWLPHYPDSLPDDPRFVIGRERLQAIAQAPNWSGLNNGLSNEENRQLAATHRPSEIAALISLGLGRLQQA